MQAGSHCCRAGRPPLAFLPSFRALRDTYAVFGSAAAAAAITALLSCSFCRLPVVLLRTVFHLFARNDGRMRPQSVRLRRLLQRRAREAGVPDRLPHGREHLGLRHEHGSAGHGPRDWYAILSSVPLPPCRVSQQYVFSKRGGVSVAARLTFLAREIAGYVGRPFLSLGLSTV